MPLCFPHPVDKNVENHDENATIRMKSTLFFHCGGGKPCGKCGKLLWKNKNGILYEKQKREESKKMSSKTGKNGKIIHIKSQ